MMENGDADDYSGEISQGPICFQPKKRHHIQDPFIQCWNFALWKTNSVLPWKMFFFLTPNWYHICNSSRSNLMGRISIY